MSPSLDAIREDIRTHYLADEYQAIHQLIERANIALPVREEISKQAAALVSQVRELGKPSMMEKFLAEYGLTTKEGVALMCLAEAMLRVPDSYTIDALIEDKVGSGNWSSHLGQSDSSLVNTSTWALLMTGKLLAPTERKSITQSVRSLIKKLGEPVVRSAVGQAMKELGSQFVLGRDIDEACKRATKLEDQGYTYSYDMLGEAARTDADALRYHSAYAQAIGRLSNACKHQDIRLNPGISVKLSALHARYEYPQRDAVMDVLVPRTLSLAQQAKAANMGFNIDAEEADRLDLSLDVIESVLADPSLEGWAGLGVVVQAFGPRTRFVLDWLYTLAQKYDRKIMVRLVKGAYWDAEIKRAQVLGLSGYPVYTRKINSDVSYLCCAKQLLGMTDRIYPQFATHNAHTVSAVLNLAKDISNDSFEFQRLHGMGESLHHQVLLNNQTRCRIYAPVGAHQDLLAYLVRRLLENGANSSFVNQIVDTRIAPDDIAKDPISAVQALGNNVASQLIPAPHAIYPGNRVNARGWDITDSVTMDDIERKRSDFAEHQWHARPLIDAPTTGSTPLQVINPARPHDSPGTVIEATAEDLETALQCAQQGFAQWSQCSAQHRADCLNRLADLYEEHAEELFALATREAGKTMLDAVGEVREAVDFARFYAERALTDCQESQARGVFTCISPWNFPLAIFSGQILAALAAGNAVLAKPAEQTVLIAARAVELMHLAGIPRNAIQLLPGSGASVGATLTCDSRIAGVCFTGSTATAQTINRKMAANMAPDAPLIAETGGLNAMIVDSTALPEQVVRDVLASAFQSAGQRCSALRVLYLQEDIADSLLEMLYGAMDQLSVGDPWLLSTDVGPVIDNTAKTKIDDHCAKYAARGRILKALETPQEGRYVAPTVIAIEGIHELTEEIFGPVLHVATFKAAELDRVVADINATGYGLTFGLHTRVDQRVEQVVQAVNAGNCYVNRNQIGAVVGSQPFGGEGLSGTGPKAGGPHYVKRFLRPREEQEQSQSSGQYLASAQVQQAIDALLPQRARTIAQDLGDKLKAAFSAQTPQFETQSMPGPTGELNLLSSAPRGVVLCLGPSADAAKRQALAALAQGNAVLIICQGASALDFSAVEGLALQQIEGALKAQDLQHLEGFDAVVSFAPRETLKAMRIALAARSGVLLPLITETTGERYILERHLCVDTTAAGGNASLIATVEE